MGDPVMHFDGGLEWTDSGGVHIRLRGWAVCCSGERCERISRERRSTSLIARVTCRACLRVMTRAGVIHA